MFGLFKSQPFADPELGTIVRSGGRWKSELSYGPFGKVALELSGGRNAPDAASLELAHQLPARFSGLQSQIEESLFEHYQPYQEAAVAEESPEDAYPFPAIESAQGVWAHVLPAYVLIAPLRGAPADGPTIEIAYAVAWDDDHTVGARIQAWRLFELCGSV